MTDGEIAPSSPDITGVSLFQRDILNLRRRHSHMERVHPDLTFATPNIQAMSIRSEALRGYTINGQPLKEAEKQYTAIEFPVFRLHTQWDAYKVLAKRVEGVEELMQAVESGQLKVPHVFAFVTEMGQASLCTEWGFKVPDQFLDKASPEHTHEKIIMIGTFNDIKPAVAAFKESEKYRRILREAALPAI